MEVEIKAWAYDILSAIHEIEIFLGTEGDFTSFKEDLKTKRAIERNLEIIGEAMSRILKKDPEVKFTDSRKIVETRNRIIHGYDSVSDEIIWSIITTNLPKLREEVERFLDE
ncbi:DUF86 domain-containing protein [Telluribacter sp. SYSU D00476]|uniref:HepT-like ribonuclease domain-containing protein n=1 Tax=Telluribacter sp. SYSU D00476 TaxID=2811430 RepID=UPI001FF3D433|nr:HepT-like ribonuclease domain-containing protein [Telluribacter sp. SYSU D00476]